LIYLIIAYFVFLKIKEPIDLKKKLKNKWKEFTKYEFRFCKTKSWW
jgi:hypothetical protein